VILDVDIGNSRLKWRLSNASPNTSAIALDELGALAEQLAGTAVSRVRVSCVAGGHVRQTFRQWSLQHFAVDPEFAQVKQGVCGLTVAYKDASKLGVDRWLAMLAAYQHAQGACVVIDAGSALTADFIDASGTHEGGLILPGVRMMGTALFGQTHGVKVDALTVPQKWAPGRDTVACVENAVAATLKGLVNEVFEYANEHYGAHFSAMVCGGDAALVTCHHQAFITMPDLVLDGLSVAFEHP
jgi:type III pantothenate kinase